MSDFPKYSFWQVQDKVPSRLIQAFTEECQRDDCRVSFRMVETTLAASSDYYTKDGTFVIENHNQFTGTMCCRKCWKGATIRSDGVLTDVIPPQPDRVQNNG